MLALIISFGVIPVVYGLHQWYEKGRQRKRQARKLRKAIWRQEAAQPENKTNIKTDR